MKRPPKCYGHFVITAPKKGASQKTHCDKKKMKTAANTKSQSDEKMRSGEANKFEERHAELERKILYKGEIAATTQLQGMTESTVKMRPGRIVAESETWKQKWTKRKNYSEGVENEEPEFIQEEVQDAVQMTITESGPRTS